MNAPVDWKQVFFAFWRTLSADTKIASLTELDLPAHIWMSVAKEICKQAAIDEEEGR